LNTFQGWPAGLVEKRREKLQEGEIASTKQGDEEEKVAGA
jgi:hypothetical protein